MHLILCGMPKSGKTSVGRRLAELLHRPFVDTDRLIELVDGRRRSCRDIFLEEGEDHFRCLEHSVITSWSSSNHSVMALGGGALQHPELISTVKNLGTVIYLKTDLFIIEERMKHHNPPYMRDTNMTTLFSQREKGYLAAAHHTLHTDDKDIESLAQHLVEAHHGF